MKTERREYKPLDYGGGDTVLSAYRSPKRDGGKTRNVKKVWWETAGTFTVPRYDPQGNRMN